MANIAAIGLSIVAIVAFSGCLGQVQPKSQICSLSGCSMDQDTNNQIHDSNNNPNAKAEDNNIEKEKNHDSILLEKVAPTQGAILPAKWSNVLVKAVEAGAIDMNKYKESLKRGGAELTKGHEKLLLEGSDGNISFTPENAYFNLNMLWALGLVNENPILAKGKISGYGAKKAHFASTGGWNLGKKSGGELLASAKIIKLTPTQQKIVEEVAESTYRPCCSNPTGFPDCNHGMAALALAELMASQGATKDQIYDALRIANSYWFTQNYLGIAQYLDENGKDFSKMDSKELLDYDYSSQNGFSKIANSLKYAPKIRVVGSTCAN